MPSFLLFFFTAVIWGSTWLAITAQLGNVAPSVSIAYRFALSAAILWVCCLVNKSAMRLPIAAHCGLFAQGAFLFGCNYLAIYHAEMFVSSGLVAVIFSTLLFFNVLGERFFFKVPIKRAVLLAGVVGVFGVALMFLPEFFHPASFKTMALGVTLTFLGAISASLGNMAAVYNQKKLPVMVAATWGMVYGTLLCVAFSLATGAEWSFDGRPAYIFSLLYLSLFGTVFAFLCYLTLIKRAGAGVGGYVNVTVPLTALLLSTFFENYQWTWLAATGAILVVAGNVLMLGRYAKR